MCYSSSETNASWEPIVKYIKDQYSLFLRKELTPEREQRINDTRIHCVLYFISPTGHALSPLDIVVLKKLCKICNVVPVVGKSDSLMESERDDFKQRIRRELEFFDIAYYPFFDMDIGAHGPAGSQEETDAELEFKELQVSVYVFHHLLRA